MCKQLIYDQLTEAKNTLENFLKKEGNIEAVETGADLMANALKSGGKIISCGNGGSMSDAMHFAEELTGKFREARKPLPAIAISDPGHITCTANDYGFDYVFSRYVEAHGKTGDVLVAISTSGNSQNVINAAAAAKNAGVKVVALTGKNGGELADHCDIEIRVEHHGYADRIQEMHIKIIHCLILLIEKKVVG